MTISLALLAVLTAMQGSRLAVAAGGALLGFGLIGTLPTIAVGGCVALGVALRRVAASRSATAATDTDETAALDCMALATSSGFSFPMAADLAAATTTADVASAIRANLRAARASLPATSGNEVIDGVFDAAVRSRSTGSPLGPMIAARSSQLRQQRSEARRTRLARLPVKLLFPLALLVLPGFTLMIVAPAVIGGLSTLGI